MKQMETGREAKVERTKERKQKIEASKGEEEDMREREREREAFRLSLYFSVK